MKLYEIIGSKDTELEGQVYGHFTTRELAEEALEKGIAEELVPELKIQQSNLELNTTELDDKVIDFTETKNLKDLLDARDDNDYVTGYVVVSLSDIIDYDFENFLDLLSEKLIGNSCLSDINYDIVGFSDANNIVFKVTGCVADILEDLLEEIEKSDEVETELEKFQKECYDLYQLDWMANRNLSLDDFLAGITEQMETAIEDESITDAEDIRKFVSKARKDWELNSGFGDSCFVCFDEFCNAEFLNRKYMFYLFDKQSNRFPIFLVMTTIQKRIRT